MSRRRWVVVERRRGYRLSSNTRPCMSKCRRWTRRRCTNRQRRTRTTRRKRSICQEQQQQERERERPQLRWMRRRRQWRPPTPSLTSRSKLRTTRRSGTGRMRRWFRAGVRVVGSGGCCSVTTALTARAVAVVAEAVAEAEAGRLSRGRYLCRTLLTWLLSSSMRSAAAAAAAAGLERKGKGGRYLCRRSQQA